MNKILIFPEPFRIKNPTCDEQNSYLIPLWMDESAMNGIDSFVEVNTLQEADYGKEIRRIITEHNPNWVIALGEPATACINLYRQKKILVNPTVTFNNLNNVPEYARQHTFGFFSALPKQEKSYELFQTVYPNTAWYLNVSKLRLIDIKDVVLEIVNSII